MYSDVARPLGCDAIEDSRALAIADLDNDGRLDMIIANNADPPAIFLNRLGSAGNFLRVSLAGNHANNLDAVGARVRVAIEIDGDQRNQTRWVEIGSGYCTQSDMRLHFGLGRADRILALELLWPDGTQEAFTDDAVDGICNSHIRIKKGTGKIVRLPANTLKDSLTRHRLREDVTWRLH